ncbi:glycosyltransferase family A protein [Marinobacter salicampi]|uniref:glycosyltransferase family A protein n=1 Tax=Marinobacter salicampi TaxID=435907 RepID=UPI00140886B3|nr:glycosyltransferase family A protein [Marinobacter salicampi]
MKIKEYPPSLWRMVKLRLKMPSADGYHGQPNPNIIVSLTSIAPRLKHVHFAVLSILNQSIKPKKVILWLGEHCKDAIPPRLKQLIGPHFEIRFREDVGPHTKLIHSLSEFPDHIIVTCDDDLMYPADWLERLMSAHQAFPSDIIGHQCRTIQFRDNGSPKPYKQWVDEAPGQSHDNTLPLGYGGVLYPVGSLPEITTNADLFRKLAPKADDLWFKAVSWHNGTRSRRSTEPSDKPYPIPFSQSVSLQKANVKGDANRDQWINLAKHFNLPPLKS